MWLLLLLVVVGATTTTTGHHHGINNNNNNNRIKKDDHDSSSTTTTTTTTAVIEEALALLTQWQRDHFAKQQQQQNYQNRRPMPFVTLAYAQSLDGRLAPYKNKENGGMSNFVLSSPESLLLTHVLRAHHAGILIGGRTLHIDNPRLNNRLWKTTTTRQQQPRPVILDPQLRHVRAVATSRNELRCFRDPPPIVCCTAEAAAAQATAQATDKNNNNNNKNELLWHLNNDNNNNVTVALLPCRVMDNSNTTQLDLQHVLEQLYNVYGIQTIMVEGGAAVLTSFLQAQKNKLLAHCVCVTIAPRWLGPGVELHLTTTPTTKPQQPSLDPHYFNLGRDTNLLGRLHHQHHCDNNNNNNNDDALNPSS